MEEHSQICMGVTRQENNKPDRLHHDQQAVTDVNSDHILLHTKK